MKKLLVAAIGVATAFGAFADQISQQRFKEVATGSVAKENLASVLNGAADPAGTYWSDPADITNEYTVSTVDSITCPGTIDAAPGKALDIKTKFGKPLSLDIVSGGTTTNIPSSGLYFDSLVKFTVCDSEPTETYDGAKIIMWLQETDTEPVQTNLYVRAGYLSMSGNTVVSTPTNYVCAMPQDFDIDGLNRVTIKAIADITTGNPTGRGVPGFAIYINQSNGTQATSDINSPADKWDSTFLESELSEPAYLLNEGNALFPTMDLTTGNKASLTSVGFDGTGSITDIVFTDDGPSYAKDMASEKASIDGPDGNPITGSPFTDFAAAVTAINDSSLALGTYTMTLSRDLDVSETLAFAPAAGVNVVLDFNGKIITYSGSGVAISNDGTLTITNSNSAVVGGIQCPDDGTALSDGGNGSLTIQAGSFWGHVVLDEEGIDNYSLTGGAFKYGSDDLEAFMSAIPAGKTLSQNQETDMWEIVYYVAPTYTVTFDSNGGSAVDSAQVTEGDTVAEPTAPTKTGFVFDGWTLLDSAYDFTTPVMSDIILVAQWRAETWADYLGAAVDGAYEIDNLTELKAFQANVATNETSGNKSILPTTNLTFKLTADIELDAAWPGIGVQNGKDIYSTETFNGAAFCGTFDGQNHTISGFQMIGKGDKAEGLDYCGFFNSTYGATIQNLKIQYAGSLFAADTTASTKESGATFVGVAKNSTLRNLTTVAGTVSCSKGFGGIVGYLTSGTLVDSCTNNVNMTSLQPNKCGGIAMITQGGSAVTIQNCQNNGTIAGSNETGGLVGYIGLDTTITDCESTVAYKLFHNQKYTVTLSGVKGNATVVSYTGAATPGLNFATVDNGVATFVANDALALNGEYKVMATNVTATFAFAEAGTIAFDQALFTPTYAITAAQGLTLTDATSGTVKTYTAAAAVTPIEPGQSSQSYATEEAAEAAAAAVEVGVPTAVATALSTEAQATYKAMFEPTVVSDGAGGYKVEVAMKDDVAEAIQAQADGDAAEVVEDLTEANVTLTTTPGLYYSFEYGTSLENMTEGARTLATSSSLELARPTTENATSGFYKVLVNLTDK